MTRDEARRNVLADYRAVAGQVIRINRIQGYNEDSDSVDIPLDPPALVRVDSGQVAIAPEGGAG